MGNLLSLSGTGTVIRGMGRWMWNSELKGHMMLIDLWIVRSLRVCICVPKMSGESWEASSDEKGLCGSWEALHGITASVDVLN